MATSTVTVLVCDIVASTARTARLGDESADEFRARFFAAVRERIDTAGGEAIKNMGDGFLVVFRRSTVDALGCARAIHLAVADLDLDDPVEMRIGVSAGEVAEEDGDVFGMPVIEASRLCAAAAPTTTLTKLMPVFAGVYDPSFAQRCAIWDVPQVSREFLSASTGATPTFIGVGELAPVPAIAWADELDRSRSNVTIARFPTLGTFLDFTGPPCYGDLMRAFIQDPRATLDVAACEARSPQIDFA